MREPELRPEFVEEVKAIEKEEGVEFKSIDELDFLVENA